MLLHFGDLFLFLDSLCMVFEPTILDYPNKYHCTWTLTFCACVVTVRTSEPSHLGQ